MKRRHRRGGRCAPEGHYALRRLYACGHEAVVLRHARPDPDREEVPRSCPDCRRRRNPRR